MKRPAHIPESLVLDYDYHRPRETAPGESFHEDPFLAIGLLREGPELFWTPRYGGHWVATRGEDIRAILSDPASFSSRAVFIPPVPHARILPLEADPPEHGAYRKIINPAFSPEGIAPWLEKARDLAIARIDEIRAKGRCEFVGEFANWFPGAIVFGICGLPLEDLDPMSRWIGASLRPQQIAGENVQSARPGEMMEYIRQIVATRGTGARSDLIGRIFAGVTGEGRPLSEAEIFGMINGVLGGGFDTTAASIGWLALSLARNPALRARLLARVDDEVFVSRAAEELVRRYSVSNVARVVTHDLIYKGVALKEGESILLQTCLYSLDETIFERAAEINFTRGDAGSALTFSHGPHRCPARGLALAEIAIFLQEWLRRIPHFEVEAGAEVRTATGVVHAVTKLPLYWETRA